MRKYIIALVIIALVGTLGYFGFTQFQQRQQQNALASIQTVQVALGSLTATVGATGTVEANQSAVLSWQTTGTVENVDVEIGDQITSGQTLAGLRQTSLPQNIILAQADLVTAQDALKKLLEPPDELALAQAKQAITNAEKLVDDSERRLASLQSSAPQVDIDAARSNVALAKNKLEQAQEAFQPYANKPEDNLTRAALQSRLAQAQKEYDAQVRRLNNLLGTANPLDLAVAESNLDVARERLGDARQTYDDLLDGPDENDIISAEARVAAAQAAIDVITIEAPFDATITSVTVKPGDQVGPGSIAFKIDDLSRLLVNVQVSEVDINRIEIGQQTLIVFDAILAREYQGTVIQVAPTGSVIQGVVSFEITVELIDYDQDVKPGMTAAVSIVVSELEDVLLVPNRAVRFQEGQRVVYVLKNGFPEPVKINLGASSEFNSEVISGDLKVGDLIVLNPPAVLEREGPPSFVQ